MLGVVRNISVIASSFDAYVRGIELLERDAPNLRIVKHSIDGKR
jgi:hypothetical protein